VPWPPQTHRLTPLFIVRHTGRSGRAIGAPRGPLPQRWHAVLLNARLVGVVIKSILRNAGVLDASAVVEARGFRAADRSRPGDVVAMDSFADGRHLGIDAVVTIAYMTTVLQKVPPSYPVVYAAKQAEDMKFQADRTSN
jgi:hypothetical protein